MSSDMDEFVKARDGCQRLKAQTTLLLVRAQRTDLPHHPMISIALDFVGPFPQVSGDDMVLSCTCRLTGFFCLIPVNQEDSAKRTARRLFGAWLSIFRAPGNTVGDCDKTWES